MATAENQSASFLHSLADHEASLLAKREASKVEAQEFVDAARVEARRHGQTEDDKLTSDVAGIRRERQAKRDGAFESTVGAAEEKLVGLRSEAFSKVSGVTKKVLELFMPGATGGGN